MPFDKRYPEANGEGREGGREGAGADEEDARLLPDQELDFEDNVEARILTRGRRAGILGKLKGPQPPQIQTIQPFCPTLQAAPPNFLNRKFPTRKSQLFLLAIVLILWLCIFIGILTSQLPIRDGTDKHVLNLDCVDSLWRFKNECGVGGIECRPFQNTSFAFRCPANCASVKVLNPRAVGPIDVIYRPLVIGNKVYRGDSFLCGSAIHAGVISNDKGGCGRVSLVGQKHSFDGVKKNGVESIAFDSYFPLSLSLSSDRNLHCSSDPRQPLILVTMVFTTALSLFSTSPKIFFPIFVLIFALVGFGSDPPSASYRNTGVLPDHISMFAKRLLPAFFCAVVLYLTVIKHTLRGMTAQVEKTLFWLGGFFFGALSNYTFDWIPIQRLTAHDLEQQPGAKVALAAILIVLTIIVIGQIYFFWLEGRLARYLSLYGLFLFGILICLAIPGVSLRIHHYIIALFLLPGTTLQTRPSLLYQGILLGLFVNGIARWDFDSILQTSDALRQDGQFDSAVPRIFEPVISHVGSSLVAVFSWAAPPLGMEGISVLVNDVERSRKFFDDSVDEKPGSFEMLRPIDSGLNEYLRFAFLKDGRTLDYTSAGTLFNNGTWAMEQKALEQEK
ncbi:hypothetical protein P280DRAFT_434523 [Massarina eburnea CBS 473.64]|uniref:LCCL domain-containing protein n=1 Tax=Massarina eburnea CBS 473.64 TaxID=1395130 RepID=A0A6A6RRJ1_9PLEO|nr:hypothetical protein P280DRAFT_434523 [Massarina eburnea CBS 473.64]